MRHKWMVILVVMVTTLTTAQEALKQYDSLKEQAAMWATSGLWAGFLNSSDPAPQTMRPQSETCSMNQPGAEPQPSDRPPFAQTIRIEIVKADGPEQSTRPAARAELLPLAGNHRDARVEAIEQAGPAAREVALLVAARELEELEELGQRADETDGPIRALAVGRDKKGIDLAGYTWRTVRLAGLAPARTVTMEAAPLAAGSDHDEALRQTRSAAAARAQSQKIKTMKKALRLLQLQLDRAARQELSRAERETITELPQELVTVLISADTAVDSIAVNLPPAPQQPAALPATMTFIGTGSSGGCAGE